MMSRQQSFTHLSETHMSDKVGFIGLAHTGSYMSHYHAEQARLVYCTVVTEAGEGCSVWANLSFSQRQPVAFV